jgi:hypothetical protein
MIISQTVSSHTPIFDSRKKGCLVYYKVIGNKVPICKLSYKVIQELTEKSVTITSISLKQTLTIQTTGIFTDDDVNACQTGPCLNAGVCSKKGASYTCTCAPCYTGTNCADLKTTSFKTCTDWFFDLTFDSKFPGCLLESLKTYLQTFTASALGKCGFVILQGEYGCLGKPGPATFDGFS